jgi:NAD(P)-dependent dehydrogenase (short-subunit alcohol dehydrogenase family)
MNRLQGKTALITGAARGIGAQIARRFTEEGCKVIINDLSLEAARVTAEKLGGQALAADVSDSGAVAAMFAEVAKLTPRLDILVNNAGILRDRVIINMTEEEWDVVVNVHLKGHFAPTHHAAVYWREQAKAGKEVKASIIHTTSTSGLFSNPGQANYDAAKSGIATLSQVCAKELSRYGVRSNAIAPGARTRLTESTPGLSEHVKPPAEGFDVWDPANVSPFVAYLATADCPVTGECFMVQGGTVQRTQTWTRAEKIEKDDRWTVKELEAESSKLLP